MRSHLAVVDRHISMVAPYRLDVAELARAPGRAEDLNETFGKT
jgi:hypothetical protein